MLVKKYEADSIEEGLALVKRELGPEALILSTQQVKRQWFRKPRVELTVAAPPQKAEADKPAEEPAAGYDEETLRQVFPHRKLSAAERLIRERDERPGKAEFEGEGPRGRRSSPTSVRKTNLSRYLDFAPEEPERRERPAAPAETPRTSARVFAAGPTHEQYMQMLDEWGFSEEASKDLVRRLIFDYPREERRRAADIRRLIEQIVSGNIQTVSPRLFDSRPCWTALGVGGAGKTSMLVKLAIALKKRNFEVTLVGADSRKIVARRQLATYARLINVPFAAEVSEDRGARKIQLVDTPGFTLRHGDPVESELLRVCRGASTFVVLDTSWRLKEMLRVVDRASRFAPVGVAFTRLDLVSQYGVIYDLLRKTKLPLLGMSLSESFKSPFKFFEPEEVGAFLVREDGAGHA